MKENTKEAIIQTQSLAQPSATIAGQIIEIFERNKLTIAQSKQILIDEENVLSSQMVHSTKWNSNTKGSVFPSNQTLGIIEYTIKG